MMTQGDNILKTSMTYYFMSNMVLKMLAHLKIGTTSQLMSDKCTNMMYKCKKKEMLIESPFIHMSEN